MDPVRYARQQFDQLKAFMSRQPKHWGRTGNPTVDAANKVRYQLKDTAEIYAKNIRWALDEAARIYKMGRRFEITIHDPQTPNDRLDLEQQRKAAALHEEFEVYIREHGIWIPKDVPTPMNTAGAVPITPPVSATAPSDVPFQPQVPQPVATDIRTLLRAKSATVSQAKQKTRMFWRIALIGLVPTLLALAAIGLEILLTNGMYRYGAYSLFAMFLFVPVALYGLVMAFMEWLAVDTACPKCEMLDAKKLFSRTESNHKKIKERREITKRDDDGKTTGTGQYQDVAVTKFKTTETYQCPFCEHQWEHSYDNARDGWDEA